MGKIILPSDPNAPDGLWRPRHYQLPLWEYLENGGTRGLGIWHRRAGKDEICLAWTSVSAHLKQGNYWHMLPEAAQARKAIWDAVDPHRNQKRIDIAFPKELRKTTRNSDMFIEFRNGSTWQVIGSDNYNSLVGSPPVGIVFSEWALADPNSWAYLKPILEENKGWALFITTSRGNNHAKRMYDAAKRDSKWFTSLLTPKQTGLFTESELEAIRNDYIVELGDILGKSMFEQEYLCSFEAAIMGAVYGKELREAREDGRITAAPYDKSLPVETWWDLGYRDATAIWFVQRTKGLLRAIDYYENNFVGLDYYAKVLQEKGYLYSHHYAPHDAAKGELGSGITLIEQGAKLGLKLEKRPQTTLSSGIEATRLMISRMCFDSAKCEKGLDALSNYHYKWDETKRIASQVPDHDWSSHGADALRTGAGTTERNKRGKIELLEVCIV